MQTVLSKTYQELHKRSFPHLKHYHADLTKWDYISISENEGIPFLHFTREAGTHMIMFYPSNWYPVGKVPYLFGTVGREHILMDKKVSVEWVWENNRVLSALYFDGRKFKEVDEAESNYLIDNYIRNIRNEWRKETQS